MVTDWALLQHCLVANAWLGLDARLILLEISAGIRPAQSKSKGRALVHGPTAI